MYIAEDKPGSNVIFTFYLGSIAKILKIIQYKINGTYLYTEIKGPNDNFLQIEYTI